MLCDRCKRELPAPRIAIVSLTRRILIDPWDVDAISTEAKGIKLHPQGLWDIQRLHTMLSTYPQIFIRVSRHWIVQASRVRGYRSEGVARILLVGGMEVPVSRRCWLAVKKRFGWT